MTGMSDGMERRGGRHLERGHQSVFREPLNRPSLSGAPRMFAALLVVLLCLTPGAGRSAPEATESWPDRRPAYEFTNGRWFNGHDFQRNTFYSVGGLLTLAKPAKV